MHFGGAMFYTGYSMSLVEVDRALEERGFGLVWAPEHSHNASMSVSPSAPLPWLVHIC